MLIAGFGWILLFFNHKNVSSMDFKGKIEEWKKKGFEVNLVPFEDGQEAYFKTPNRRELKLIFSKATNGGAIAMTESYVKNCYLGGTVKKEGILDDNNTSYLAQLSASIDDLLGTKKVQIKKL